jgi:hypothetical protein
MKILILLYGLFIFPFYFCTAQHLIGLEKSQVSSLVKKEMKGFSPDHSTSNRQFNYLRFVNSAGTITLFIFLDENNFSASTRMVCDYSEMDFIVADLSRKYRKIGENEWEYSVRDETYTVNLDKKEWYFTVSVKKKVVKESAPKKFLWWKRRN